MEDSSDQLLDSKFEDESADERIKRPNVKKSKRPVQPPYDKTLQFCLSPNQIFRCILYNAEMFTSSWDSFLEHKYVYQQIKAENGDNYCWLAQSECWQESNKESNKSNDNNGNLITECNLEIKIGKTYLYAEFGCFKNGEYGMEESWR